jgi:hypothetical protein
MTAAVLLEAGQRLDAPAALAAAVTLQQPAVGTNLLGMAYTSCGFAEVLTPIRTSVTVAHHSDTEMRKARRGDGPSYAKPAEVCWVRRRVVKPTSSVYPEARIAPQPSSWPWPRGREQVTHRKVLLACLSYRNTGAGVRRRRPPPTRRLSWLVICFTAAPITRPSSGHVASFGMSPSSRALADPSQPGPSAGMPDLHSDGPARQ